MCLELFVGALLPSGDKTEKYHIQSTPSLSDWMVHVYLHTYVHAFGRSVETQSAACPVALIGYPAAGLQAACVRA